MFTSIVTEERIGFGAGSEILGYLGIIFAFIPLFLGVRSFRDTTGQGYITFSKAFTVGIMIIVVSGLFFSIASLISDYWITPELPEKYSNFMVQQVKASGKNLQDTIAYKQQMVEYKELKKDSFIFFALTFALTLPLGAIMTLICAAFLRRSPPPEPETTDAVVVEEESQKPE